MTGCFVSLKCFVACKPGDESQHPTWPHTRHMRRATHLEPVFSHSSHPLVLGSTSFAVAKCSQLAISFSIDCSVIKASSAHSYVPVCVFSETCAYQRRTSFFYNNKMERATEFILHNYYRIQILRTSDS